MSRIKNAVILAAGLGSRLKPLTDEIPKCLTEINGQPILLKTLKTLEQNGIQKAVIVVGYLGDVITYSLGSKIGNMKINYIKNDIYDETNSMYSAWLAREYLENGALLIEGDTIYEDKIIESVLKKDDKRTLWIVDKFTPERNGSMEITDKTGRIKEIKIVRQVLKKYQENYFKSAGMLKITPAYGKLLSKWLDQDVRDDNVKIYYDLVIEKHLKEYPIYIFDVDGAKWQEIDTLEDLKKTEDVFVGSKYVIIIIDGAADDPLEELGEKTPLEKANIPNLDFLTSKGKTGLMRTMLPGLPIGSVVANMGLLGFNPARYYPNGRASFEALAQDIFLGEKDLALRCNLVSVENGILTDANAGNIVDEKSKEIINRISEEIKNIEIYPTQSYRSLIILRETGINANELCLYEPHMNVGRPIKELKGIGKSEEANKIANKLNDLMMKSIDIIKKCNEKLKSKADMVFPWSPSSPPLLPSFHKKFGIDGAIITGMDFLRGIAIAARMEHRKIPGVTGFSDTDLKSKLKYSILSLKYNDLIFIHINAPDEESHSNNIKGKVEILEKIDKEIIGPLFIYLEKHHKGNYRIAILPDHYTYVRNGKHGDDLVPYMVFGKEIERDDASTFSEKEIFHKSKSIIKSYEFLDFFLIN